MIRSIDVLSRNFSVLQQKQQNLSANTANATTPGYKYQKLIQSALPQGLAINHTEGPQLVRRRDLGNYTFGNQIDEATLNFDTGSLKETGIPTDFAAGGSGYFTIQAPGGQILYTKNGRFTVNDAGQLVTREGYVVQTTGNVVFDQNTFIDADGYINGTNNRLIITSFDGANAELTPANEGYFTGQGGQINAQTTDVYQGYLESSNVQMADVMVELLQITREFEANQKVLHASNETLNKATNEIGKA